MYRTISYPLRLLLTLPPSTHSLPPCIVLVLPPYELYSLMPSHKGNSVHLLPAPLDYWYTSSFFMEGPGLPPEIAVSTFSQSSLGHADVFSFLPLVSTPRLSPGVLRSLLSTLALLFPVLLSCLLYSPSTHHIHLRTFSTFNSVALFYILCLFSSHQQVFQFCLVSGTPIM